MSLHKDIMFLTLLYHTITTVHYLFIPCLTQFETKDMTISSCAVANKLYAVSDSNSLFWNSKIPWFSS